MQTAAENALKNYNPSQYTSSREYGLSTKFGLTTSPSEISEVKETTYAADIAKGIEEVKNFQKMIDSIDKTGEFNMSD